MLCIPTDIQCDILDVCKRWGVELHDVQGPRRFRRVCRARQEIAYMLCTLDRHGEPFFTLQDVGDYLGGRNHSTVAYSVRQHARTLVASQRSA